MEVHHWGGGATNQLEVSLIPDVLLPMCLLCVSELAVMSLLDHEEASSRAAGSDCDPPAFSYQPPVPHPYSSPHPLHQLHAWGRGGGQGGRGGGGGGGSQHSEGDIMINTNIQSVL